MVKLPARLKRVARSWWRFMMRQPHPAIALERYLAPSLAPMACIDVGASFFVHRPWRLFLHSPSVLWVAVEPNVNQIDYLKDWSFPARLATCFEALSGSGGERTLFVTSNPNGSSILKPRIPAHCSNRSNYSDFFYPLREVKIDTITLSQLLSREHICGMPFVIKLDTQGSELEILKSAESYIAESCVGIEVEASLLCEPPYANAAKFWQINQWVEGIGFELMSIASICYGSRHAVVGGLGRKAPVECDAIFTLRQDRLDRVSVDRRLALMGYLAANAFYEEALSLFASDQEIRALIHCSGVDLVDLERAFVNCL